MSITIDYGGRARAFVGTPFRAQGRSKETGVDCVGLILGVYRIAADSVRRDYRLRGDHQEKIERELELWFRRVTNRNYRRGDVLLMAVASDQLHLAIATDLGFVHADAGLGLVVETPGPPKWPVIGVYRRASRKLTGR
jgi:cell wall-associated NlpC family hydrolase